jgi:uncharacterized protein
MLPLTNLLPSAYLKISEEVRVPLVHLVKAISLFEEGATVPFLARYRKEATGNMDEEQLRLLQERLAYFRELEDRRQTVLKTIEEQGKLTPELRAKLEATLDKNELEDLYQPYKPKRKTRASAAREKGLEPLAAWLRAQQPEERTPEAAAEEFVNAEKGVENVEQALAGARDIVAEQLGEEPANRQALRKIMWEHGVIVARKSEKADDLLKLQKETRSKYETYYDFREPVAKIPSHRLLAIRRGVKEGFVAWDIELEAAGPIGHLLGQVIRDRESVYAPQLEGAVRDGYQRLLEPSIQNEVSAELKARADAEAIRVFQDNIRSLLLAPPAGPIGVLGLDPGLRTGCKLAVVDQTGKFLESAVIHPGEPRNDVEGSRTTLKDLIARQNVRAIAIGNGTGSREADLFVRALIRDEKLENIFSVVVSEAGASVYSASRMAREEFPDTDVIIRGAISIARRLQDPLAELVKIEPKSIGVGQYQHDVDQNRLAASLHDTVESCVNRVGVELNTASAALLKYVAGLNDRVARRIIEFRQSNGRFQSRDQLRQVPGVGERTFVQAAGFLRIRDGENPLDRTAVHPEAYAVVGKMAASLSVTVAELVEKPELVDQLQLDKFATEALGLPTLTDIREEIKKPGRDPRESFVAPHYRDDILLISDLKEGLELEGVVTNVTNFGAFVDVGVHQDGLVHVSELSGKFVKDPREAVNVGDIVKVRVLGADPVAKRISLSMKPPPVPKPPRAPRPPRPAQARAARPENGRGGRPARPAREKTASERPAREPAAARPERTDRPERTNRGPRPERQERPAADRAAKQPPKPQAPPLSIEEKLALLQSKFRTRV